MSQKDVLARVGQSFVGVEDVALGTRATVLHEAFFTEAPKFTDSQDQIDNMDQSIYIDGAKPKVQGFRHGEGQCSGVIRPATAPLLTGVVPTLHWLADMLGSTFGGRQANAGSLVQATSSTTMLKLATGDGALFPLGTIAACMCGGSLFVFVVDGIPGTDEITPWPSFPAAPDVGGVVVNFENFCFSQGAPKGLSFQHALAGDGGHQWERLACAVTGMDLKFEAGKPIGATWKLQYPLHRGPTAGIISTPLVLGVDPLVDHITNRNSICYIQPAATLTRNHYPWQEVGVSLTQWNDFSREGGGPLEGVSSLVRSAPRNLGQLKLKHRTDTSILSTYYANKTPLRVLLIAQDGVGAAARFVVLYAPNCRFATYPDYTEGEKNFVSVEYSLDMLKPEPVGATTDLARAAVTLAYG
jgi:hypothetical protein